MNRKLFTIVLAVVPLLLLVSSSASAWSYSPAKTIMVGMTDRGYFLSEEDSFTYEIRVPDAMMIRPTITVDPSSSLRIQATLDMWPTVITDNSCDDAVITFEALHEDGSVPSMYVSPCPGTLDIDTPYTVTLDYDMPLIETEPYGIHDSESLWIEPEQPFLMYHGTIDPGDFIDTYEFWLDEELTVSAKMTQRNSSVAPYLRVRRQGGGEVAYSLSCGSEPGAACLNDVVLEEGEYWLEARTTGDSGDYALTVDFGDDRAFEPNDSMDMAENPFRGTGYLPAIEPAGDVDYYSLVGYDGDVFRVRIDLPQGIGLDAAQVDIFDEAGTLLESAELTADQPYFDFIKPDDDYQNYIRVTDPNDSAGYPQHTYYWLTVERVGPYVSADKDGLGGRYNRQASDLLVREYDYDLGYWWDLVFDASDVGITRDVTAAEFLPNGTLLLSLDGSQKVAGLGTVTPQDIIRFVPNSGYGLGRETSGRFELYLDGSDVGLTTVSEKIDAIARTTTDDDDFGIAISITGSGNVPIAGGGQLAVRDEDLIRLDNATYGANSAGTWSMHLDGSRTPGMGAEDLRGATLTKAPDWRTVHGGVMMLMQNSFRIDGIVGGSRDVLFAWQDFAPTALDVIGLRPQSLGDRPLDAISLGPIIEN